MRSPQPWSLPTQPASRAHLAAGGVSDEMLATAIRAGVLMRVRRGVYLATAAWPDSAADRHVVRARAELAATPDAVISRQSAGVVWGFPSPGPIPWHSSMPSISVPAGTGRRTRSTGVAQHVELLPAEHVSRDTEGYSVTSPARTAIDLARGRGLVDALVILDAVARHLCSSFVTSPRRSDFANPRLVRTARDQLHDMAVVRRASGLLPAIELSDPRRESPAESLSAGHFQAAGLPAPECQPAVETAVGRFYPDFLWRDYGVIGECDGAVKYAEGSHAFLQEKIREQALRDAGFVIVRWLAAEIMSQPGVVIERVARALAAAGAPLTW